MNMKQKILYLDCFSGISGDMFLGSLIDIGVPLSVIEQGLMPLGLAGEYHLHAEKTSKSGIQGTSFSVHLTGHHHHDHHHHGDDHHHGRTYADIRHLIETAPLPDPVRQMALAVFLEIGQAEAAVHGVALDHVHFHEVGAIDSIVDIVGTVLALDYLKIDRIQSSSLQDGSGSILCQHGSMPVPVPAVMKMLENTDIPYVTGTSDTELVTPTGFSLVKTLASSFGSMPQMKRLAIGYGFGQRDIGRLNALRIILGETTESASSMTTDPAEQASLVQAPVRSLPGFDPSEMDRVVLLSCHIDNSTAEQLGYLSELMYQKGALDVALSPLQMKKNRPGHLLTVLVSENFEKDAVRLLFTHTGTIGIRREWIDRHVMTRSIRSIQVLGQAIRIKTVQWQDVTHAYPEYEDIADLARRNQLSLEAARERIKEAMSRLV